jgi:hypothetical protein
MVKTKMAVVLLNEHDGLNFGIRIYGSYRVEDL